MEAEDITRTIPSALENFAHIQQRIAESRLAFFLDYDGTLTPIVSNPEDAKLDPTMKEVMLHLSERYPLAVISGRDLADVQQKVGIDSIYYAGSHGFDIQGPGLKKTVPEAETLRPQLKEAEKALRKIMRTFPNAKVEGKKFSIAVHYRNVERRRVEELKETVYSTVAQYEDLKLGRGKEVLDLSPRIDWDKGKALLWLLENMPIQKPVLPLYIGDDLTDEDAFRVVKGKGIGLIVKGEARETLADYAFNHPDEVRQFLEKFAHG